MALVTCPECGRQNVSDTAEFCPDCGYSIKTYYEYQKELSKYESDLEKYLNSKDERKEYAKEMVQKNADGTAKSRENSKKMLYAGGASGLVLLVLSICCFALGDVLFIFGIFLLILSVAPFAVSFFVLTTPIENESSTESTKLSLLSEIDNDIDAFELNHPQFAQSKPPVKPEPFSADPPQPQQAPAPVYERRVRCPKCGCTQIATNARGINWISGPIGASKTVNRCAACGYTWAPKG